MMKDLGALRDELGPEWDVVRRRRKKPGDTPAFDRLHAAARKLADKQAITYGEALAIIFERHPRLYAEYEREKVRALGESRHRPAYQHAEMAALMKYALQRLDEPEAMFAAALALGEYHQFDWQEERKRRELHALIERHAAARTRKARDAGKAKRGARMAHTRLIEAATKVARPCTRDGVLALLRDEHEVDSLLDGLRGLAIVAVDVDDDARTVAFCDERGVAVRTVTFAALEKTIQGVRAARRK
ncbi:MAG: hypothetical protein ACRERC_00875 [Candidatus Binatia bacterium]